MREETVLCDICKKEGAFRVVEMDTCLECCDAVSKTLEKYNRYRIDWQDMHFFDFASVAIPAFIIGIIFGVMI